MKTNLPAILRAAPAAILLLATCAAHAAPNFTESYVTAYGEGTHLGTGTTTGGYNTKWPTGNSANNQSGISTVAARLTYSALQDISAQVGSGESQAVSYGMRHSTNTGRDTAGSFTQLATSDGISIYWSFLINVTATTPTARNIGGLRNSTGSGTLGVAVGINASRQLTLSKSGTAVTHGTTLAAGTTYFVVARYKQQSGADEVALWVNPATGNVSEPTISAPDVSATTGSEHTGYQSLRMSSASDTSGPLYIDEHRVTTNWADATPSGGPCVAPDITSQPVAATACGGDVAVFTVGASGSSLVYQWQKNGAPISNGPTGNGSTNSGVTTATLIVSGVALADAALAGVGYDCIITNSCGTTNSDRVALTVNTSPAAFGVTGGGAYCSGGGGVAVGLAGSESGVTYYLRLNGVNNGVTTNGTGAAISFDNQTAAGTYTVTATNGGGCGALMTTNVVVTVNSQPGITTEPVGATVAVGGSATYNVVATGGSLTYQWRTNGVNLNNATNASYTVYPAALSDALGAVDGYDCTITGPCGSTNSARVALTVNATSDLIWAGDGAANLWNTLGAANWSNGVALVQFASGDRVTFDDSSVNLSPVLSGVQIPTAVTVNAAANYTFTGGGSVGGSLATLTKDGSGTLTLGSAHSYGGGTVISNGTVVISNNASLGTGAATLAGGSLTTIGARSLANGLNATASGTLTYTGTGDNSLNLNSTFNVGSGATLTITHAAAGPDRLRVFDTNTTVNGDIVLNGAGIAFACYSASGTQTFNGVISGNGQVMRRTANAGVFGTTIFNGNNTYSGNTTLTDGVIGFGLSSTGDPVTAGPIGTGTLALVDSTSVPSVRTLFASGGARTVANAVTLGGAQTNRINGADDLTLAGTINLGGATRAFEVNNTGKTIFANAVSNGGLTKNGNGALYLNGTNTYTGPTTVNAGTLGGTGVLVSAVSVAVGGNLAPGASIGLLTISNDLTLNGTFTAEVDSGASPNCDQVAGLGTVTYGGTLAIVNGGPALTASDTFQIFSAITYGGAFASITPATPGASLVWNTNTLTTDGTLRIAAVGGGPATNPTNIVSSFGGGNVTLSWPSDHLGWTLQTQTNSRSVGLVPATNAWFDVSGSTSVTNLVIPISSGNPTVFYRLMLFVP